MDGLQGHTFLEHISLAENDVRVLTACIMDIHNVLFQIMDLVEIEHLTDLQMLRILNLKLNPVEVCVLVIVSCD